jgi:hypothetical protein
MTVVASAVIVITKSRRPQHKPAHDSTVLAASSCASRWRNVLAMRRNSRNRTVADHGIRVCIHASFRNAKTDFRPRRRIRRTGGAMSMRSLIVGAFAASVIAFTAPLALAEEPATPHYTAHHHHDETRHPYSRFRHHHRGPSHEFGMHHRATTPGCSPWQTAAKTCVCGGSTKGHQFICHPGQWCHPYFGCTA